MTMTIALLVLVLLMRFGPDTDWVRALRRMLVERPVALALTLDRKTLVAGLIMALLLLGGGELLILFGPEFLAWYATNLAIYADALAISALLAVRTRLRHVAVQIRSSLASVWRVVTLRGCRPRAIRPPKTTRRAPSGNDNDSDGGRVLAAA